VNAVTDVLRDEPVSREIRAMVGDGRGLPGGERLRVTPEMVSAVIESPTGEGRPPLPNTEAVVLEFGRPSLLVRNGRFELPKSKEMRARLLPARQKLEAQLASVGRIEFRNHPRLRWGGTGWLIADKIIVTNEHVARNFAVRASRGYKPIADLVTGQEIATRIDFREEYQPSGERQRPGFEVAVRRVIFMAPETKGSADVALLELEQDDGLPAPIPVAAADPTDGLDIAVVGYPARDPGGVTSAEAALETFRDIYQVKRLSPGKVLIVEDDDWFFTHDATTLHGSSGSAVLDLNGNAVGLHFSGDLERANYAVKPTVLLDRLGKLKLHSSVLVPAVPPASIALEGVVGDYDDRAGYDPSFLGSTKALRVDLPTKKTAPRDLLTFGDGRSKTSELKYEHFSVAMSRKRKLCVWSAVNIDGSNTSSARRTGWRIDPRIPKDAQTVGGAGDLDIYGDAPKFARGHMTRREDPIWGLKERAKLGNSDSMHLTNAVPQMQPFNAGIWLKLEDYALEHAEEDKIRISVTSARSSTPRTPSASV